MGNRIGEKIKLTSIDELLCVPETVGTVEIELGLISEFANHPFRVVDDEKMEELVGLTEDLINDICDYSIETTEYTLQCTDATQPGYISTNQPASDRPSNQIEKAIDGSNSTFFMSNRTNNDATEPHHLKIDLGSGISTQNIQFYMYGHSTWNYATAVNVYGSNSGASWVKVASLQGMKVSYTSEMLKANTK